MFKCKLCGYCTDYKQNFENHLSRKKVCKANATEDELAVLAAQLREVRASKRGAGGVLRCDACGTTFTATCNMYRHRKRCGALVEATEEMANELAQLRERVQTLERMPHTTTNNTTNNITVNNQVTINAFGSENIQHLLADSAFMDACLKRRDKGLLQFIRATYFDKEKHPENSNVRVTNYKMPIIDTFNGTRWIKCDKQEVLQSMIDTGVSHIEDHYDTLCENDVMREKFTHSIVEIIHTFMEKVKDPEQHTRMFDEIKKRLHLLIVNESTHVET